MRRLFPLLALLLAGCRSVPTGSPTLTAFVDVTVLSMRNDDAVPGQTVIVREGVIERIGDAVSTPAPRGATRIEGQGRFLMPGPVLYFSGPLIDGPRPIFPRLSVSAETEQDARRIVAQQRAAGYDFVKTYVMLPPPAYRELVRAAHEQGIAVIGHTPARLTLEDALAVGHDLFLHVGDFVFSTRLYDPQTRRMSEEPAEIAALAAAAARAGVAVAPTMVADLAMIRKIRERELLLPNRKRGTCIPTPGKSGKPIPTSSRSGSGATRSR